MVGDPDASRVSVMRTAPRSAPRAPRRTSSRARGCAPPRPLGETLYVDAARWASVDSERVGGGPVRYCRMYGFRTGSSSRSWTSSHSLANTVPSLVFQLWNLDQSGLRQPEGAGGRDASPCCPQGHVAQFVAPRSRSARNHAHAPWLGSSFSGPDRSHSVCVPRQGWL